MVRLSRSLLRMTPRSIRSSSFFCAPHARCLGQALLHASSHPILGVWGHCQGWHAAAPSAAGRHTQGMSFQASVRVHKRYPNSCLQMQVVQFVPNTVRTPEAAPCNLRNCSPFWPSCGPLRPARPSPACNHLPVAGGGAATRARAAQAAARADAAAQRAAPARLATWPHHACREPDTMDHCGVQAWQAGLLRGAAGQARTWGWQTCRAASLQVHAGCQSERCHFRHVNKGGDGQIQSGRKVAGTGATKHACNTLPRSRQDSKISENIAVQSNAGAARYPQWKHKETTIVQETTKM